MPFITSSGLTGAETSRTVHAGSMTVHYHDIGSGDPVLFLHSSGPGTRAWIIIFPSAVPYVDHHLSFCGSLEDKEPSPSPCAGGGTGGRGRRWRG